MSEQAFMQRAVALALEKMRANSGGPFGAVIVRNDTIIAEGWNEVTSNNDPTAHAEIVAIRRACTLLGAFNLPGCDIYTSCEPCPMCLGPRPFTTAQACHSPNENPARVRVGRGLGNPHVIVSIARAGTRAERPMVLGADQRWPVSIKT